MKLLNWSCQKIHCSVDDTLWIFKDLTEHKEYVSIFENPILNKIKELHLKFGAVFTCYCFLMLGIILHLPMRQIDLQKNLKKCRLA